MIVLVFLALFSLSVATAASELLAQRERYLKNVFPEIFRHLGNPEVVTAITRCINSNLEAGDDFLPTPSCFDLVSFILKCQPDRIPNLLFNFKDGASRAHLLLHLLREVPMNLYGSPHFEHFNWVASRVLIVNDGDEATLPYFIKLVLSQDILSKPYLDAVLTHPAASGLCNFYHPEYQTSHTNRRNIIPALYDASLLWGCPGLLNPEILQQFNLNDSSLGRRLSGLTLYHSLVQGIERQAAPALLQHAVSRSHLTLEHLSELVNQLRIVDSPTYLPVMTLIATKYRENLRMLVDSESWLAYDASGGDLFSYKVMQLLFSEVEIIEITRSYL